MPRTSVPLPYTPSPAPTLDGGDVLWGQQQFDRISATLNSLLALTPQPATAAPKAPQDGMIRLARSPWRPVSGQTADKWVYWDAPSGSWLYL
jgi:hypothetical protein